ncbi:hypothetical protein ACQKEK_02365 [Pseudomonas sp. NPDC077408]
MFTKNIYHQRLTHVFPVVNLPQRQGTRRATPEAESSTLFNNMRHEQLAERSARQPRPDPVGRQKVRINKTLRQKATGAY